MPAFEFAEIVFERQLAAPEYHIIDLVFCQIAEGGCKAVLAGEEVLVNAEHSRTIGTLQFRRLAAEKILKVTLHGGVPDAFSFSQPAAVDAIPVQLEDVPAERLRRPLMFENSGKLLPEVHSTLPAQPLMGLDVENTPVRLRQSENHFQAGQTFFPKLMLLSSKYGLPPPLIKSRSVTVLPCLGTGVCVSMLALPLRRDFLVFGV